MLLLKANDGKKRLLIISFYFPPILNPGAIRMGAFAKYLPEFGWNPEVLTVKNMTGVLNNLPVDLDESKIHRTNYFSIGYSVGQHKYNNLKASGMVKQPYVENTTWQQIVRKPYRLLRSVYSAPLLSKLLWDPMGWYFYGLKKGEEILAGKKFDIIFSTYNPSVPHLIASQLHRQTGIPWVADFRDLWTHNPYVSKTQPFQFIEEHWEKRVLSNCNFITSVSEPLVTDLEVFHSKRGAVIYNGYNEDDFKENISLTTKFTITYTGQIYHARLDPAPLFQALSELKGQGVISLNNFEVRFFGTFTVNDPAALARKFGLEDIVKTFGFIPFQESIKMQKESTALLLLGWNDPNAADLPSKTFEYLATGRPILAIAYKDGPLKWLIRKAGSGIVVNSADEIKEVLAKWLTEFHSDGEIKSYLNPNPDFVKNYSRKESTKKLATIFDNVINSPV